MMMSLKAKSLSYAHSIVVEDATVMKGMRGIAQCVSLTRNVDANK